MDCSQVDDETLVSMTTEEIEAAFNRPPWTTAILVDIDKPDRRRRYWRRNFIRYTKEKVGTATT